MSNEKRKKWLKEKMATDEDYRENQKAAQKTWLKNNPNYYKNWRQKNPEYVARNREAQKRRNKKRKTLMELPDFVKSEIAKMNISPAENTVISGYYRLTPLSPKKIAKIDTLIVKIDIIPTG